MRYRIRVISFALILAILFSGLFLIRSVWFPSGIIPDDPKSEPEPSSSSNLPEITSTPSAQWPPLLIEENTPSPEPLFDTSGL